MMKKTAFQIENTDNVATVMEAVLPNDTVTLLGSASRDAVSACGEIPKGHKMAVEIIPENHAIQKYGVVIGKASRLIPKGSWVHLHCMESNYDERSAGLDVITGAPSDIQYE